MANEGSGLPAFKARHLVRIGKDECHELSSLLLMVRFIPEHSPMTP
jgi:hypothetical protein